MTINDNRCYLHDIKNGEAYIPDGSLKFEYEGKILKVKFKDRKGEKVSLPWNQVRIRFKDLVS